ncbi:efflux transporter outer membrane subunit [Paenalcaligenes niemegkensis]|uniref:efflux transporter outer membrane subunit n=1 Tax=Paenalcaligenes niemegkensis TaxID=2895469 RepID=UPI001EE92779|nr:efflux transporter outer membrane subunit [Paenalcaligenes niemegkensis]MCQ9616267.1 efflux transporter outer membrane subunit [Paenalcaligenes niemegkensis]
MVNATMKFSLSSVCAAVLLSACSFAPTYERPAAPIPSSFPLYSDGVTANTEGVVEELGWSDFFKDARLQAIIALALDNNRDMRIAVERVQEARAQYGVVRSDQFPSIGLGATGQVTRYPEDLRVGGPDSESVSKSFQAGIGLTSFEIDLFGRLRNLSAAALEQYLATESAQRAVRINVVSQVAEAYFRLRTAQEMQTLMRNTEKSRSETLRLVQLTYDVGTASSLELNQATLQLQTVRADLEQARRNEMRALNALTLLTGTELPTDLPEPQSFGPEQLVNDIPVGLPSDLLQRRPDLITAEHALRASNANIGAARAAFFPSISITGLLGFASPSLTNLFGSSHRFWQYSPQISMPIFTGGSVQSGLDIAEARNNIAVAQYEQSIQNAFREVADALAGEATYSQQLDALRAMISSANGSLNTANLRYETGIDSFLQVQTAEINLYSAQQIGIQVGLESLLNRIELYKALGGGWKLPETADEVKQASAPVEQ